MSAFPRNWTNMRRASASLQTAGARHARRTHAQGFTDAAITAAVKTEQKPQFRLTTGSTEATAFSGSARNVIDDPGALNSHHAPASFTCDPSLQSRPSCRLIIRSDRYHFRRHRPSLLRAHPAKVTSDPAPLIST